MPSDQISDELAKRFAEEAQQAAAPTTAGLVSRAQALPVPVPVTKGQAMRDPAQQMFESQSFKGVYGEQARERIQELYDSQQEALTKNIEAIQGMLSGGERRLETVGPGMEFPARGAVVGVPGEETAAARLQNSLEQMRKGEKTATSTAYEMAREAGAAKANMDAAVDISQRFDNILAEYGPDVAQDVPRAVRQANRFEQIINKSKDLEPDIDALFQWRKFTTKARKASTEPAEQRALGQLIREFDTSMKQIADNGLMTGDPDVIVLWRDAIKSRAAYGARWQSGDLFEKVLKREFAQGENRLVYTPNEVSNLIFGASRSGLAPRQTVARDLGILKNRLGPESEEWLSLREEAFLRIIEAAKGGSDQGKRLFSGNKFNTRWERYAEE